MNHPPAPWCYVALPCAPGPELIEVRHPGAARTVGAASCTEIFHEVNSFCCIHLQLGIVYSVGVELGLISCLLGS